MMTTQERKRMPQLVVDEVLLLVDTYFQIKRASDAAEKKRLTEELSINMRCLPFFREAASNPEFRSFAGMQMCLANVGYLDPDNPSKFGHGSALQKKIFDCYENEQTELHKLAQTIVKIAKETFPIDYSFANSNIGMLIPSYHLHLERSNKTVLAVKKELAINNDTVCRACKRDLSDVYGEGSRLIEVHIDMPIYKNSKGVMISPSELIAICPTCHKLAHMEYDAFEMSSLLKHLKE